MNIASASMKLPMKRKMIGSANGAKTTRAGATLQDDGQHRPDERGHRQRQRLGNPEDHHHQQDGREAVCWRGNRDRRRQENEERQRAGDEPDRPAPSIEQFFRG